MSRRAICTTIMLVSGLYAGSAVRAQNLVWSEEFDGPGIDPSKWTFDVGGHGFGNAELQYYTARPQNVRVENGALIIKAIRESYSGKAFTSSRLKTHGRFGFKYGTIQARVKIPNLQNGLWPAFWLLGQNIGQHTWPACGEVDIMEMGDLASIQAGTVNRTNGSAAHWDFMGNYALYGQKITAPSGLNGTYHTFSLSWTPNQMAASLDGSQYWTFDISGGAANSLEEFHQPMFMIINLAVGGINFVQITDPNAITAPLPAEMSVDWIRLYDNPWTELYYGDDIAESGNFGVFTETTPVNNSVAYGVDSELYIWNNMTAIGGAAQEGTQAWNFNVAAGNWFGMGVFCLQDRNMSNYSDGFLKLHMKTSSNHTFSIGVASSSAGEGWVTFAPGGDQHGLVRDGQWHEVVIPANLFGNVDFNTIKQIFMIKGEAPSLSMLLSIDNVYWVESAPKPTPQYGNFGVYTETPANKTAGEYVLGVDGQFYVWENTLVPAPTSSPYEGAGSIALVSNPGPAWFGAAFTPTVKYNLTAFRYENSKLHFAMKTSSTVTFQIGMKSGSLNDIGQQWITFRNGQDPYGFVRDGQWHVVEIPMSEFTNAVNLAEVSQLFELLGTEGPISGIEIDDIAFINGGAAITPGGPVPGDMNCDQSVDLDDVPLFTMALLDPVSFDINHPACNSTQADMDSSATVDAADIAGFVSAVLNP